MKRNGNSAVLLVALAFCGAFVPLAPATEPNRLTEKATFSAGCFWGVEAAFRQVKGVTDTVVGYMGGTLKNPSYEDVTTHRTGHMEVCQVTYDPAQISYEKLVAVFFKLHNPTSFNPAGHDLASQYRSVIFFHTPAQEKVAGAVRDRLQASGKFEQPIAAAVVPATEFWRAEEYHQRYAEKRNLPSCSITP
jgi:peptide-methionine (S)-S-oxide reductase